jgi:ribose transport system substrate-binding protein
MHTQLDEVLASKDTGVEIKWYDNKGDPQVMLQNVQLMIQDKPDALVVYPVTASTQGISQMIKDSGIPCVTLNLDTPDCDFLNIDNSALGIDSAKIVGEIAKSRGWDASNTFVLIGQNAAAGEQVNACVTNFYSTIADILGLDKVAASDIGAQTTKIGKNAIQFDGNSQLESSFTAVSNLLPSVPAGYNIILYTVNNDSTSGALRALAASGRADNDKTLIAGLGGDKTGVDNLRSDPRWVAEGDIFFNWWGQYAVAMAQALAKGIRPPADVTALPQVVLSKDTVDQYLLPDSVEAKQLPALDKTNEFLKEGGFLQIVNNIPGL